MKSPLGELASPGVFPGTFYRAHRVFSGTFSRAHRAPVRPPCSPPLPTGIIGNVYLNDSPLKKFKIYNLEMDRSFLRRCVLPCAARGQKRLLGLAPALPRGPWDPLPNHCRGPQGRQ